MRRAIALTLIPFAAWAAEAHEAHHAAPSILTLLWPVLNFVLFLFVLARFAWPAVKSALIDRRVVIEKELAEATTVRREAEERLQAVRILAAGLAVERDRLIAELRGEGEHERTAIIAAAGRTAVRIRQDARLLGEQEAARAAREIRREVADRVAENVRTRLRDALPRLDQDPMVDELLVEIPAERHT